MKPAQTNDERFTIWSAARAEANLAYQAWCDRRGAEAYAVYRADAAEQALVFAVRPPAHRLTAEQFRAPMRLKGNRMARRCVQMGAAGNPVPRERQPMSTSDLKRLLDDITDTREIVLRRPRTWSADYDAWSDAHEEAEDAYRRWMGTADADDYVVYRAAQDREDAAQDTLSQTQMSRTTVS